MNQGRRIVTSKNGRTKDLLLRYPNFVAKSPASSFELTPLACEAGALTTELTALEQTYFSRIFVRRKQTPPALLAAERSAAGPALATRDSLLVTPPLRGERSTQNTELRPLVGALATGQTVSHHAYCRAMIPKGYYVGVDGCRGGWVSVALRDGKSAELTVHADLAALWEAHREAEAIFIDMPIGLLEHGPDERACERNARRLIGVRRASVFPVPCRQAVHAGSDVEAVAANLEHMGRGLPLQTLAIRAKIRQVDELLRSDPGARSVFREIHPELLFCAMNGGNPMTHRKKRREGKREREILLAKLAGESVLRDVMVQSRAYRRRDVGWDDILDALAAAVAGSHPDELVRIPENPPLDACGLPMQMVYWSGTMPMVD